MCSANVFAMAMALSSTADAGYFTAFIKTTIREAKDRAERKLTAKELSTQRQEAILHSIHSAIHNREIPPTVSGVAKKLGVARPTAYGYLSVLVERGKLQTRLCGVSSVGRTNSYISRMKP